MSTQPLKKPQKKPAEMSQKSTIKKGATPLDLGQLLSGYVPGAGRLHVVCPQGENAITYDEVGNILCVIGQGVRTWQASDVVVLKAFFQLTVVEHLGI